MSFNKSILVLKKKYLFLRKGADQERSSRNGGRTIYVTSGGSKNKASRTDEFSSNSGFDDKNSFIASL